MVRNSHCCDSLHCAFACIEDPLARVRGGWDEDRQMGCVISRVLDQGNEITSCWFMGTHVAHIVGDPSKTIFIMWTTQCHFWFSRRLLSIHVSSIEWTGTFWEVQIGLWAGRRDVRVHSILLRSPCQCRSNRIRFSVPCLTRDCVNLRCFPAGIQ
jgi:hypothetical protein